MNNIYKEICQKCCPYCDAECDGCWLEELINEELAEERKRVVQEIKQRLCRVEDTLINLGNGKEDALNYFVKILDQIERGER